VDGLIRIKEDLENSIESIVLVDLRLEELKKQLDVQSVALTEVAAKLSESRQKVIPSIEKSIVGILRKLGMPNGRFAVKHSFAETFTSSGKDKIDFMFSANKHSPLHELKKVASGGEFSRLMLSLKSLIANSVSMPTIIFDEIDTGVSGDIADKNGEIIAAMAEDMQVINITHLPQIASKGQHHYLVYKSDHKDSTETNRRLLTDDSRLEEIAKMLSGKELTNAALANARELLLASKKYIKT